MTDQNQKRDAGKARPDLIPWHEFQSGPVDHSVAVMAQTLQYWWRAAPHALELTIPARQLPGIARVLAFGAAKYAPRGWESGIQYSRLFAAAVRHADAVAAGDFVDAESGLAHESHFWCNVLFLVVFAARGRTDLDDRPAPVAAVVEQMDRVRSMLESAFGVGAVQPPRNPQTEN